MIRHTYRHRVRYRECDPMGIVYHTHYLDYFEAARTEALREMGVVYKDLETAGVIMPVIDASVKYLRPARYDDVLVITTMVDDVPSLRVCIDYEVHREVDGQLLATGRVTLCFVDVARNRPIPAPDHVAAAFQAAMA